MVTAAVLVGTAPAIVPTVGSAADAQNFVIVIKNHRFEPAELVVPAGERVKLVVHNQDSTPEEFESHDLRREKIIPGGRKATIWVGPLPAGEYGFFGEFNQDTALGKLIAK
jgi:plastocyanin